MIKSQDSIAPRQLIGTNPYSDRKENHFAFAALPERVGTGVVNSLMLLSQITLSGLTKCGEIKLKSYTNFFL